MKTSHRDRTISGFSKLNKRGRIKWLVENFFKDPEAVMKELMSFWHKNEDQQKVLDRISENTISNFPLPFSVAPNFVINGKTYCVPMVIEESSVVAAAASSAKYWMKRGGFHTKIIDDIKLGQIHLNFTGDQNVLDAVFQDTKAEIINQLSPLLENMEKRGGGIRSLRLKRFSEDPTYVQILMEFNTCDSMGANFINTILEEYAKLFYEKCSARMGMSQAPETIMCILSNYTPNCLVRAEVRCPVKELGVPALDMSGEDFARRFEQAVRIATFDPFRAVTHNKGIFNGVDAVVLATGNDFRAVESCGHAYASRHGQYRSLSACSIVDGEFIFSVELPMAIGTVGGLTKLHPMARRSLELLGNPGAQELMQIIAAVGLAQNFAALRSLVTIGIQKGHMKMHLSNLLYQLQATDKEFKMAIEHFSHELVSYSSVRKFINKIRSVATE